MAGFEAQISGVRSNRSTTWATSSCGHISFRYLSLSLSFANLSLSLSHVWQMGWNFWAFAYHDETSNRKVNCQRSDISFAQLSAAVVDIFTLHSFVHSFRSSQRVVLRWEPWSSGYEKQLMFERSWVQIPVLYTGWTRHIFRLICCENCIVCLKRPKINKKRPGFAQFLKKSCFKYFELVLFFFIFVYLIEVQEKKCAND